MRHIVGVQMGTVITLKGCRVELVTVFTENIHLFAKPFGTVCANSRCSINKNYYYFSIRYLVQCLAHGRCLICQVLLQLSNKALSTMLGTQ